jgi:two-component system, response regulator
MKSTQPIPILMADDDPDDRMLAQEAMEENKVTNQMVFVENGEELLDYLHQRGAYNAENAPRPGLILLDLNMPLMDGREALRHIKSDPGLRRIPVVILTTSKAEEDIVRSYDLGVNSFITKPVTFDELVKVTREISSYWFGIVELPS